MDNELDALDNSTPDNSAPDTTDVQSPDMSGQQIPRQDDQQQMSLSGQPVQQQPAQPQQSVWQQILTGALVGMAGSSTAKNFGQGLAGGAQSTLNYQQQQTQNQMAQNQQDMEKQRLALQTQTAGDEHATAQQNLAVSQANLAILHTNYAMMPKTVQDALDQADMKVGATLKGEGVPVISGQDGLSYQDAQQRIMAERNADPNSALQFVMHSRPDGKFDIFQVTNPDKTNDNPVDVTIGYDANTGKPISKTYAAHSISIAQIHNLETNAAVNMSNTQNEMEDFKKKNAITTSGEIAVAKAKQQMDSSPVYAIDNQGNTVMTTKAAAISGGMNGIRPVKEADITKDQHDIKVLSDIQTKTNNVAQTAGAMDSNSWAQAGVAAKYLADNPNTTINTLLKSAALKNATPQTQAYVIAVNSLRESAMGLQKVLTGSARSNETQMSALLNTLPGVEPNSGVVKQKLNAFGQNLSLLAQGLPKNTGVELQGFNGQGGQAQGQTQPMYAQAPGKPRLMSSDGGKTWTPAP